MPTPTNISRAANYALTPDDMAIALQWCIKANVPVMLWGQPGSAKSSVVAQTADALSMALCDIRLAQMDMVDLRGIPTVDNATTQWARPNFLPTDADPETVVFLDEISSAMPAMQVMGYQIALDRRCGDHPLPESARVIAAGNRAEDKAVVHRMSTALASRFVHLDMKIDVDAWMDWAISGPQSTHALSIGDPKIGEIPMEIIFFMRYRPELISTFDPKSKESAFACPRTWEFVARLVNAGLRGDSHIEMALLRGAIGEGAAVEFASFLQVFKSLPDPMLVIKDPLGVAMPDSAAAKIALCGAVARIADDNNMDSITAFAKRDDLRTEYGEFLVGISAKFNPDVMRTKAYIGWESYISKL